MALNQFPRRAFSGAATLQTFTGNGSTTTFTLNEAQYQNECFVYVDDVAQVPGIDFTINSTTLTFTSAPANSSEIIVRGFGVPTPLNSVSDGSITSAKLATGAIEAKLGYTPVSPTLLDNTVNTSLANLVNSAPSTLDTLNELATALGNDPNFATTITTTLGTKSNISTTVTKDSSTGAINVPTGTTAQRPGSPSNGLLRFNNDLNQLEIYSSSSWRNIISDINDGSTPARAATSASAIKSLTNTSKNGAYWIKASANAPAQLVYCIMDTSIDSSGGWMIISHNDARNHVAGQSLQPRPTAYTSYVGTTSKDGSSYNQYGIWNINARDMSFTDMVFCVYDSNIFTTVRAYAWGHFNSSQTIPTEASTWSLTPNSTGQVLGNLGNKRIWGVSSTTYSFYNFAVQNATNGSGGGFYPYFGFFYNSLNTGAISFCGEGTSASTGNPNTYGFDDWQDGNGLGDVWGVEGQSQNSYRGYASYVMIR